MGNLIDDITNTLGKNRKILFYAILTYIVIMIVVLLFIWWPEKKWELEYTKVNIQEKQKQLAQDYMDEIALMFITEDKEAIKGLVSDEYVNYLGITKDDIIKSLDNDGYFSLYSQVRGMDIYTDGNTYVYSTNIYSNNNNRRMNIIETYPYEYDIVFDDFYDYKKANSTVTQEGIKLTITSVYRNLKYIEFEMKIENLNNTYARFDFNSSNCVQAVLEDANQYSAANLVSTGAYTNINSNETITKKFVFEIPAQLQNGIEYIVFNNVKLEFSQMNIKVKV